MWWRAGGFKKTEFDVTWLVWYCLYLGEFLMQF